MSFINIALPLAERGFRVFPLIPKEKRPVKMSWGDHFDAATTDRAQLELWDREVPRANVGISPDEIFCFVETDDEGALKEACKDLPPEIWDTTRVSARDNRCYYIFRQTQRTRTCAVKDKSCKRDGKENLFEFKAYRTYVTGPGSVHPKTNAPYAVEWRSIPALPDILLDRLCELIGAAKASEPRPMSDEPERETATLDRFLEYYEVAILGDWFNKGKSWYRPIECPWSSLHENPHQCTSTCVVFTEGSGYGFDCKHRCAGRTWKEFRAEVEGQFPDKPKFRFYEPSDVQVSIGREALKPDTEPPKDWRTYYHTAQEHDNVGPPRFLIEGFLPEQAIMGIGAFIGQKKTIAALNIVFSLCSGESLFGKYKVNRRPSRVLYLGPENGLISFSDRSNRIGLRPFLCKTFFYTTMSMQDMRPLSRLTPEEIEDAAIVIDTAIRFTEGNENDAAQMKLFAEHAFALIRNKAAAVILLHHSPKTMTAAGELTLENSFRGTGELTAFLSVGLAMKTQDMNREYDSASLLRFVKQRDFEPKPPSFEVTTSRETCRMTFVDGSDGAAVKIGNTANKDGKDEARMDVLRRNTHLSLVDMAAVLKKLKMGRSPEWIRKKRAELEAENKEITYHVGGLTIGPSAGDSKPTNSL